jgi:hypothetical protein
MSAINSTVKHVVCGVAAMVISLSMSWSMVKATATYPYLGGTLIAPPAVAKVATQPPHAWFGQPSPAVLVD